tara:strand:+ start:99164 stop:99592 length:429 start_codon:yes stop_codon:yes gene_type:complete
MNSRLKKYVTSKFTKIAQDLIENPQGLKFRLENAKDKLSKQNVIDALGKNVDDFRTLVRMAKLWITRKYNKISKQSIILVIMAIIYFITPTDFVPDFILGLGYVDDISVLKWVMVQISEDLAKFKEWEADKSHDDDLESKAQ